MWSTSKESQLGPWNSEFGEEKKQNCQNCNWATISIYLIRAERRRHKTRVEKTPNCFKALWSHLSPLAQGPVQMNKYISILYIYYSWTRYLGIEGLSPPGYICLRGSWNNMSPEVEPPQSSLISSPIFTEKTYSPLQTRCDCFMIIGWAYVVVWPQSKVQ